MTDLDLIDKRIDDLAERVETHPERPLADKRISWVFWTAAAQAVLLAVALIAVVIALARTETNREAQCVQFNSGRAAISETLTDSRLANNRIRGATPESDAFYEKQISRFRQIDCENPSKSLVGAPTTTSSVP